MIRAILTFALFAATFVRGASYVPIQLDSTTRVLASPTNAWTANSAGIYNALGLGGMSLQSPSSVSITGGSISGITDLDVADGGTGASTAAGARSNLGLGALSVMDSLGWSSITNTPTTLSGYGITDPIVLTSGSYSNPAWLTSLVWGKLTGTPTTRSGYGITDAQPLDSELTAIAGLTSGADLLPYFTGSGTATTTTLTTFGRSLIDDADAATARTTLGAASTAGTLAQFGATTSAQLFGTISDKTGGSGVLVGSASPTFTGTVGAATITATGVVTGSSLTASSTSGTIGWSDAPITRPAANTLQLGAADSASPSAVTVTVPSVATGTANTAGANTTWKASAGSGTGAGGSLIWQTAPAGSSGSTQNPFVTQLTIPSAGGFRIGSAGGNAPYIFPFSGTASGSVAPAGLGVAYYSYVGSTANADSWVFTGDGGTATSGTQTFMRLTRNFAPTSGTGVYNELTVETVINQTGGANGITRGIYVNPTLTAAADYRALEVVAGNVVLPKTVTAAGTTGAQTINKVTGSVNFAAAATSLVVTDSYVTANSIITATVASNDTTMKSVAVVAGSGSFTIYPNAAPTAETRVNFHITN